MKLKSHPYFWAVEPLAEKSSFIAKPMFGSVGCYYDGRIVLVLSAREEPWRGLLVTTDREHHKSLLEQFPSLAPHEILPKWLYLPESDDCFEPTAQRLVELILNRDPRMGTIPKKKKKKHPKATKDARPPHLA